MKKLERLNPFGRFCCTIGNLPASYMESLTYEEQLIWFCDFLENKVIPAINDDQEAIEELQALFVELKDYVEHYLDNLDLQTDINNKLDEMALDGTLGEIINQEIFNELNNKVKKLNLYAPSLYTSSYSEMCNLIMGENENVLFDLGSSTSVSYNKSYLESKLGDNKINAVFISHYHADHVGGLEGLADLFADDIVFYLPMNFIGYYSGTSDMTAVISLRSQVLTYLNNNNITYYEVNTNRTIDFDDFSVKLTNSNDSAYSYYNTIHENKYNAYSMVCTLVFGDSKILFPADTTESSQDYLVANNEVEKVNIMVANHHGYERTNNTIYAKITNPDYVYFSISPLSLDNINLMLFDSSYRTNPKYATQCYGDVEYSITKNSINCIKGFYDKEELYYSKSYEVYVDPNFNGLPDGSATAPYKSINQVFISYPNTNCDLTINLVDGTYDNIRLKNLKNSVTIKAINSKEVIFSNEVQLVNNYDLTFNGIVFNANVVIAGGNTYFNNCNLKSPATTSGNVAITLSRAIAQFYSCLFTNCYTGIYANLNNQITSTNCIFECNGYAVYATCSYVSLTSYTLTSGVLRSDQGSIIQTITRGNTANRPLFNNSNHMQGYMYFDQTLGQPIFYKNSGGADGWVDSSGSVV